MSSGKIEWIRHIKQYFKCSNPANCASSLCNLLAGKSPKEQEYFLSNLFGMKMMKKANALCKSLYLTSEDIKWLYESGIVEVGSHTVNHVNLTSCDSMTLEKELVKSKIELEKILNVPVNYLSYPNGFYSSEVIEAAKQAGYTGAFATGAGSLEDEFALRRVNMGLEPFWRFMLNNIPILPGRFDRNSISQL